MPPSPSPSRAALAAGVPARFLYWTGRSSRRYLFSCTGVAALADFEEGIAMAVRGERIVWVGEVAALARMPEQAGPRRAAIYLHLLATTAEEQRAVIEDLRPQLEFLRLADYRRSPPTAGDVAWSQAPTSACA
jgi:hypothetical protein